MALRQIKVPVASNNGGCSTECSECSTAKGLIDEDSTILGDGILLGSIVPRTSDNASKWVEGCQCYVNFEYDDAQLAVGVVLKPCDIALVCGPVVDLIAKISSGVAGPPGPPGSAGPAGPAGPPGTGVMTIRDNGDGSWDILLDGVPVPGGPIYTNPIP